MHSGTKRDLDDPMFLEQIQQGNLLAFQELVEEHQHLIVNTCYRFLLNHEDAEEVAQEVFCEVFQRVGSFKGKSRLSTWMYRIAVNRSMDLLRKQRRHKRGGLWTRVFNTHPDQESLGIEDMLSSPENQQPDHLLSEKEHLAIMQRELLKLPEKQQKAFVLKHVEGLSQKEIAEIMDVSESAAESLMFRARARLKKNLTVLYKKSAGKKTD